MNANELADKLERQLNIFENDFVCDAATMLRQQQAEIEALKHFLKANELYLSYVEWSHTK